MIRMRSVAVVSFLLIGCSDSSGTGGVDGSVDSSMDAHGACTSSQPFVSESNLVLSHNGRTTTSDGKPVIPSGLSADELTAYYTFLAQPPSAPGFNLSVYAGTRTSRSEPFGDGVDIGAVNNGPTMRATESNDGLELYFAGAVTVTSPPEIYRATRSDRHAAFANRTPIDLGAGGQDSPSISTDGSELFYWSSGNAAAEAYLRRATRSASTFQPQPIPVQSPGIASVNTPVISADGLTLYFSRYSEGIFVMWKMRRGARGQDFTEAPTKLTLGEASERPIWESPDGCRLYVYRDGRDDAAVVVMSREP